MGAPRPTRTAAPPRAGRLASLLAALAVGAPCAAPHLAQAAVSDVAPLEPDLRVPVSASEKDLDGLAPGDARRVQLLVELAVRRHAESLQVALEEERERPPALAEATGEPRTRAEAGSSPPAHATPHADALRAEALAFALQAADEGPGWAELPDALIVGGLDAERIGRGGEAARLLGILIRRHPESRHVGDAWLALAERHLRTGDLTRARVALDQAEHHGRASVRAWAAARGAEVSLAAADLGGAVAAAARALEAGAPRAREVIERIAAAAPGLAAGDDLRRRISDLLDRARRLP